MENKASYDSPNLGDEVETFEHEKTVDSAEDEKFDGNVIRNRYSFNSRSQLADENVYDYVEELTYLSASCEYGDLQSSLIRDRLICDVKEEQLREQLLIDSSLSLSQAVLICQAWENAKMDIKDEECSEADADYDWDKKEFILAFGDYDDFSAEESNDQVNFDEIGIDENVCRDDEEFNPNGEEVSDDDFIENEAPASKKPNQSKSSKERTFICDICSKGYTSEAFLLVHQKRHSREPQQYSCDSCTKSYSRRYDLKIHKLSHSAESPFTCRKCPRWFKTLKHVQQHQKIHGGACFLCTTCGKDFRTKVGMLNHSAVEHGDGAALLCDVCNRAFPNQDKLRRHQTSHSDIRSFLCDKCDIRVKTADILKNHMKLHAEVSLQCSVCGKGFTRKESLKVHMLGHNGQMPHQCKVCGKTFAWIAAMRSHMSIHSGEKRYKCSFCEKTFRLNSGLQGHLRTHTKLKPESCDVCHKAFPSKANLKKHKQRIHDPSRESANPMIPELSMISDIYEVNDVGDDGTSELIIVEFVDNIEGIDIQECQIE